MEYMVIQSPFVRIVLEIVLVMAFLEGNTSEAYVNFPLNLSIIIFRRNVTHIKSTLYHSLGVI